jgi:hypothetical protein
MATDATGAPTSLGIPKFDVNADAPSGLGGNAQMDSIDALIAARVTKPAGIVSGEVPVWNGTTWVRSTTTNIGLTSLGSGTPDATKYLRGDGLWAAVSAARAMHNTSQAITTATLTALALNSERFDNDAIHDTATNNSRLTCKTAGKYQISGSIEWASNATGERHCYIRLNGATSISAIVSPAVATNVTAMSITTIYDLAVNDYVELAVYQTSGGNLNINSVGNSSPEFMMVKVA